MKRPLWVVGITFLLSIRIAFYFFSTTTFLVSFTAFSLALCVYFINSFKFSKLILILFSCSLGFAVSAYYTSAKIEPFNQYKGELIRVEGIITEVSSTSQRSVRYKLDASFPELDLPSCEIVIRDYIEAELNAGDSISTVIELSDPKYETTAKYYDQNGIIGEGALLEMPKIILTGRGNFFNHKIIMYRTMLYEKTTSVFSPETATIVNNMVFGLSDSLDANTYTDLNRTGISHLISISGMHLSLLCCVFLYVLSFLKIKRNVKYTITIIFALFFSLFVGLSPAIVRSLIMTIIYFFGKMIYQQGDSLNSLGLAAIITGFLCPVWVKSLGLWLSYLATAGIIIVGIKLVSVIYAKLKSSNYYYNKLVYLLSSSISISLGAYLFTLPVLIFTFGWVSVISPLANLLSAPFSAIIIVFAMLGTLLPQSFPFYPVIIYITEACSKTVLEISRLLSRLSVSTFSFNHIFILIALMLSFIVIGVFAYKKQLSKNSLSAFLAVCLVFSSGFLFSGIDFANHTEVTSLSDNQLVISKGNSAVVFVKNDKYSVDYVLKYLDYKGIDTITALVCLDYTGKATSIFDRFRNNYKLNSVIGPADHFYLEMLANLLSGTTVYSSENNCLEVFGDTVIDFADKDYININIRHQNIILSYKKYDIINNYNPNIVYFLEDQQIVPRQLEYHYDFLGRSIYNSKTIRV